MKFFTFLTSKNTSKPSSDFSHFFREASSREKKKVFMDVARKASADQRELINQTHLKTN